MKYSQSLNDHFHLVACLDHRRKNLFEVKKLNIINVFLYQMDINRAVYVDVGTKWTLQFKFECV